MKQLLKNKPKQHSIWSATVIGILFAIILTLLGATVGTLLINGGTISEAMYPVISTIILFVSSLAGTLIASKVAEQQILMASAITAFGYLLVLASIQILFFESVFDSVWQGILSSLAGLIVTVLLSFKPKGRKKGNVRYRKI